MQLLHQQLHLVSVCVCVHLVCVCVCVHACACVHVWRVSGWVGHAAVPHPVPCTVYHTPAGWGMLLYPTPCHVPCITPRLGGACCCTPPRTMYRVSHPGWVGHAAVPHPVPYTVYHTPAWPESVCDYIWLLLLVMVTPPPHIWSWPLLLSTPGLTRSCLITCLPPLSPSPPPPLLPHP